MDLDRIIKHFGSVANIALALGISKWTVYQWRKRGVPLSWQTALKMMLRK